MTNTKETIYNDFTKMICESWTFGRLTTEEKMNCLNVLKWACNHSLRGDYKTRWNTLHATYYGFICALGYMNNPADWRGDNK